MEATRERARPCSLGQPRLGIAADGDGVHAPAATPPPHRVVVRGWRVCRGPQGVAGLARSVEHLGDPGGAWAPPGGAWVWAKRVRAADCASVAATKLV